jgi:hypothetical protein
MTKLDKQELWVVLGMLSILLTISLGITIWAVVSHIIPRQAFIANGMGWAMVALCAWRIGKLTGRA